jgi:hypothetical protein
MSIRGVNYFPDYKKNPSGLIICKVKDVDLKSD